MGIALAAMDKRNMLRNIPRTKMIVQRRFRNPSLDFKPTAPTHSKIPAIPRMTQFIWKAPRRHSTRRGPTRFHPKKRLEALRPQESRG